MKDTQLISNSQKLKMWEKVIGYNFIILNGYYILRFILTIRNRYQTLSIQSIIVLLGLIFISVMILYLLLKSGTINTLIIYFSNGKAIYEIFIVFLISSQLFKSLKYITSSVAFETRGWFISNYIFIVISYCIVQLALNLPDISNKRQQYIFQLRNIKSRSVFLSGLFLISSIIIGYWVYTQIIFPLPEYFNYDPEYQYMLTSTTPFKDAELYKIMGHPGTFMQMLGTLFTVILSPVTIIESGFPTYINLTHPEYFVFISRLFVLVINLITFTIIALVSLRKFKTSDIFAALSIPLIYFSSHRLSLEFTGIWSPNSFSFALGSLLSFYLFHILTSEKVNLKKLTFISIVAGLIGTFHIYMITWSVGIATAIFFFFLFTTKNIKTSFREMFRSILHSFKGYIIGTLVIVNQLGSFIDWILDIISHQGIYGGGQPGFISRIQAFSNFQSILKSNLEVIITTSLLIICLVGLYLLSRKKILVSPGAWAMGISVIIQILLIFALIVKHPGDRYLLSISALLPILLISLFWISKSIFNSIKYISPVFFSLLFVIFCWTVVFNVNTHLDRKKYITAYEEEIQRFVDEYAQFNNLPIDSISKYWTYGSYSECYSLWFANQSAKNLFTKEITEICSKSEDYSYDYWTQKIYPSDLNRSLSNLDQYSIIIGHPKRLFSLLSDEFIEYQSPNIENLSFFIPIDQSY